MNFTITQPYGKATGIRNPLLVSERMFSRNTSNNLLSTASKRKARSHRLLRSAWNGGDMRRLFRTLRGGSVDEPFRRGPSFLPDTTAAARSRRRTGNTWVFFFHRVARPPSVASLFTCIPAAAKRPASNESPAYGVVAGTPRVGYKVFDSRRPLPDFGRPREGVPPQSDDGVVLASGADLRSDQPSSLEAVRQDSRPGTASLHSRVFFPVFRTRVPAVGS